MIDWTLVVAGALLVAGLVVLRAALRRREPGAPMPEILDDTEPLDPRDDAPGALVQCPHGRSIARGCEECDRQWRAPHVTLDDDEPKGAA